MKTVERIFRLEGTTGLGAKPNPGLLGALLVQIPDTLRDAVRMGFLHSSRAGGRLSRALQAASEVRFAGCSSTCGDFTDVCFELPLFGEAAPELFAQGQLWDDGPRPESSAFDLLSDAVIDIGAGRSNSDHFDKPLLSRVGRYGVLFKKGLQRVALVDDGRRTVAHINAAVVESAHQLSRKTPASRRVRVTGKLDLMGASQGVMKLHLRPGEIVTALWTGQGDLEQFKHCFNADVVVEGTGVFRPSGTLLRVEADAVAAASSQDEFFRELPKSLETPDYESLLRVRPGERSAYHRILGVIPAEESDEEFAAAIEAFS
ncbi:MAG: hypothetical protein ACOYOF_13100 [Verrucomicrobiaceae bacterium]